MGTYSGLRVRGRIKPEFVDALQYALDLFNDPEFVNNHWQMSALEFPQLAALQNFLPFAVRERADFIPGWFSDISDWYREDPNW